MRTFGDIKDYMDGNRRQIIQSSQKELERTDLRDFETIAHQRSISECLSNLENINEVTLIEIGATANSLIRAIQNAYKFHLSEYWSNFEKFCEDYIIGMTPDGNLKTGAFFGQYQCWELGITINDLMCFKGKDPMKDETCDIFRQAVNAQFGTNIPMAADVRQAYNDFHASFGADEATHDEALVHLKEIQQADGTLRNGGQYYTLATNKIYQDAKERCATRGL